jgi:hypothetical protein
LSLHVLYQGCGIPVAWKIVKGTEKGSWKPHWLHLFQSFQDAVPKIPSNEDNQKSKLKKASRTISCFLQGLLTIIADLLCGKGISLNGLFPESSFAVDTS